MAFIKHLVQHRPTDTQTGGSLLPKVEELLRNEPLLLEKPAWPLPRGRKREDQACTFLSMLGNHSALGPGGRRAGGGERAQYQKSQTQLSSLQ